MKNLKPEKLWTILKPLFEEKMQEVCSLAGVKYEEFDCTDEEYAFAIPDIDGHSVTCTLGEEAVREGEGGGFAIIIGVNNYEGDHFGNYCPYNYTAYLWTRDVEELKSRIARFNPQSILKFISEER